MSDNTPALRSTGVLELIGVDRHDHAAIPFALAKVPTENLKQVIRQSAVTFAATITQYRIDVGWVLWALRGRLDDAAYKVEEDRLSEVTGFSERTLRKWRQDVEAGYGLPVPPAQEAKAAGARALNEQKAAAKLAAQLSDQQVPEPQDVVGAQPQPPPGLGTTTTISAVPPPRGNGQKAGVEVPATSPGPVRPQGLKAERVIKSASCPPSFAYLLREDPDEVAASLSKPDAERWVKEVEAWIIAFKGALVRGGNGKADDVPTFFKKAGR